MDEETLRLAVISLKLLSQTWLQSIPSPEQRVRWVITERINRKKWKESESTEEILIIQEEALQWVEGSLLNPNRIDIDLMETKWEEAIL